MSADSGFGAASKRFVNSDMKGHVSNDGEFQEDPAIQHIADGGDAPRGDFTNYNAEFAFDEAKFWQFLEATQADELAKLHYKPDFQRQILERLHLFRRRLRFSIRQRVSGVPTLNTA